MVADMVFFIIVEKKILILATYMAVTIKSKNICHSSFMPIAPVLETIATTGKLDIRINITLVMEYAIFPQIILNVFNLEVNSKSSVIFSLSPAMAPDVRIGTTRNITINSMQLIRVKIDIQLL